MHEIRSFADDLRFALGVEHLRIQAPLPGTKSIEVLIPRDTAALYSWQQAIASEAFKEAQTPTTVVLGQDEFGNPMNVDLHALAHLLISGVMGSGKSNLLHCIVNSLIVRNAPDKLKLILIDPKRSEFGRYNPLAHMLTPAIDQAKQALLALKWLAKELDRRYDILVTEGMRDIEAYHEKIAGAAQGRADAEIERMPYIVLVIDELSNLMEVYPLEFEAVISRLTQLGQPYGMHLIISLQIPTAKVLTSAIAANIPARIALKAASTKDSLTIIHTEEAEGLGGVGDMIYLASDFAAPLRARTANISNSNIDMNVKKAVELYGDCSPISHQRRNDDPAVFGVQLPGYSDDETEDELYEEARETVIAAKKASTAILQRKLRIGYGRAARLIDLLEERGVVGPADGAKGREVWVSE
jgi:S-DNA-T family DNA segregation ATPase FtsK/SpoIIIE